MKNVLYYFSGTGNTLAGARLIAAQLPDCELVSIPRVMAATDEYSGPLNASIAGIVAPIYMHKMPRIVSRFIDRLGDVEYLFMVYTGGGDLGSGIRATRRRFSRAGLQLSALFNITMPSNYAPYGYPDKDGQAKDFAAAERKIEEVVDTVTRRAIHFDGSNTSLFQSYVYPGPLYRLGYRFIPRMDSGFAVADTCTACGICARVCPVGNVSLVDGRPEFHHRCEQCYACLQWCPVQAIDYGEKTHGVQRYHHPDVGPADIETSAPDR